jgi:hypothetical protein
MAKYLGGAIVASALLLGSSGNANAQVETALQVQSWCRAVANAPVRSDDRIGMEQTFDASFCWGAFATIQLLTEYVRADGTRVLGICVPPNSTRLELVKIFSKYLDEHPQ